MRILHVTDVYLPRVGGIEVFVSDLARHQVAAGHDVHVLTATRSGAGDQPALPGVHRATSPLAAAAQLRAHEYDVVHAHLSVVSPFSTLAARSAVRAGIPTVLTVHSMWSVTGPLVKAIGGVAGWQHWPVVWTTVSRAAADDLRPVLGADIRVHVVPNAVDVDWWREPGPRPQQKDAPVTVVSVMRLSARKRPLALLRMLQQVRRQVPPAIPIRAVLVGDGPLEDRLRAELRHAGMSDWVTLAGRRNRAEIRDLCRDADLYVAPARHESFGIAALEARAAGLPVVAMATGGVGEFVRSGVEGLLCADDAAMVRALVGLTTDADARHAMAAHNRRVAPAFDWGRARDAFDEAYALAGGRNTVAVIPASWSHGTWTG